MQVERTNYTLGNIVTVGSGMIAVISAVALAAIALNSLPQAYLIGAGISTAIFTGLSLLSCLSNLSKKEKGAKKEEDPLEGLWPTQSKQTHDKENIDIAARYALVSEIQKFAFELRKEDKKRLEPVLESIFNLKPDLVSHKYTVDEIRKEFEEMKSKFIPLSSTEKEQIRKEGEERAREEKNLKSLIVNLRGLFGADNEQKKIEKNIEMIRELGKKLGKSAAEIEEWCAMPAVILID